MGRRSKTVGVGITLCHTEPLRDKLVAEITEYQRQQAAIRLTGNKMNFSLMQTYKELIHARQEMLQHLPPRF
jgi:hypothetical protein